jgi:hypothetical protein
MSSHREADSVSAPDGGRRDASRRVQRSAGARDIAYLLTNERRCDQGQGVTLVEEPRQATRQRGSDR